MNKPQRNNRGSGALVAIVIVAVVSLVGVAGWLVYKNNTSTTKSAATSSMQSKAKEATAATAAKLSELITNQGSTSSETANSIRQEDASQSSSSTSSTPTSITYQSKHDSFHFKYSSAWTNIVWSNDLTSSGITVTSPGSNVLLSYGTPVTAPSSSMCTANSPKQYILDVEAVPSFANSRKLYLIKYTDQSLKSVALTDWEGQTPVVGTTDKCSGYQPAYIDKDTGTYSWFKISDTSSNYRLLDASAFYNMTDVKDAITFIKSGSY